LRAKTIAASVAIAAAALAGTASAASARILPGGPSLLAALPVSATSLTLLTGDPDSGHGTPAVWAIDSMWRTETVTRGAEVTGTDCGLSPSAACWAYTSSLSDSGTFRTVKGAGTPNQSCTGCAGEKIRNAVNGSLSGTYQVTFYASSGTPSAALVPWMHNDHDTAASPPFTSTTWGMLFFPAGTSFGAFTGGAYSWTYEAATAGFPPVMQTWVDSSTATNNDGNAPGDGNITG
jgi:hypothetical protein